MNMTFGSLANHLQTARFAALFLDALLKSLVVLALAGGVCALWRGASAGTRHLIWFLAVASLPFLPLVNSVHPAWRKPVWSISSIAASGNEISLAVEFTPKAVAPPAPNLPGTAPVSAHAGANSGGGKILAQINTHWLLFGSLAWLAGFLVFMTQIASGQFYRRKFYGGTQRLQDADWTRLLREAGETLRLRRPVTLLQSANGAMPMTWGCVRPVVLLPAEAAQWPDERRRVVLLHELAHVKRGDYLTQSVAQVVCALYWFNPLVWLAARQMCVERESACDDLVLRGGCKASDYAGHLVEIAASFRRVPQIAAIAMARSSRLELRIAAIVDGSRNRRLRLAAVMGILAIIGGIAVGIGGTGNNGDGNNGAGGTDKSDALRQQQIARLEAFSSEKEKQSQTLAAAVGETISPEFQHFFDAAKSGDRQTVTKMYESFRQHHPQYSHPHQLTDVSLRTSYWGPVLEICLAYDHVAHCDPEYTQMAVDGIIDSIPAGSIYFGGTDPGRGLPTAFCKSHVDADPFYTLTQNALADSTYLQYLDRMYGKQRALLGQLAEACSKDSRLQEINNTATNLGPGVLKLRNELATSEREEADAERKGDPQAVVQDLQRKIHQEEENLNYFEKMLEQNQIDERDTRVNAILAEVQKNAGSAALNQTGPAPLYIPTTEDSQRCFQDYTEDAEKRLENHQLKPGEDVKKDADGRIQVKGQEAVMAINGLLAKIIFDKNPGHEFYIEESFPLDWMYPYLEPHGLIMKINREPLAELSDDAVKQDFDYWQPREAQMVGGWLTEKTPLREVIAFSEKVFLQHDLDGFAGDTRFAQNDYAQKMFSKWRSSIAGLYAWRAENAATTGERKRMARAADFAFRQALALCPYSPEATYRYMNFLNEQHREADVRLVMTLADRFKPLSAAPDVISKVSVFQMRLALDAQTDNTEPMRLESRTGAPAEALYVAKEVLLDDTAIKSAKSVKNGRGFPEIDISFTDSGRKQFAEITRQHLHQKLAIIIDGKLWMAPVIQTEITGGKAEITGSFTDDEARDLAAKINEAARE